MKKIAVLAATFIFLACTLCFSSEMVTIEGRIEHSPLQPEAYAIITTNGKIYEIWSSAFDRATKEFAACITKGPGKVAITIERNAVKKNGMLVINTSTQCMRN